MTDKVITRGQARKMQSLITKTAAANAKYYWLQDELNSLTEEIFGHTASDIDCDWIIDSLFGGAGAGTGMTLSEYVKWMNHDGETEVTIRPPNAN